MSLMNWSGKRIVVTGASSGIGLRTAELLMETGATVIALDRNTPPMDVSRYIHVDLGDPDSIDRTLERIEGGPIHGLCNIAGVSGTAGDEAVSRVNYIGMKRLTGLILPHIEKGGAVVNLCSTAGNRWPDRAGLLWDLAQIQDWDEATAWIEAHPVMLEDSYSKFKEALVVWTKSVASEWFMRHGVRINCVSPGPVETPIFDDFVGSFGRRSLDDIVERTGRIATPDDVAHPVLFLLSDLSRWIVGVDLAVEGGLRASRLASVILQGEALGGARD